jgi:hypothetical protein
MGGRLKKSLILCSTEHFVIFSSCQGWLRILRGFFSLEASENCLDVLVQKYPSTVIVARILQVEGHWLSLSDRVNNSCLDYCKISSHLVMTTNSRIPPLLSPYIVSPPKDSLILLTSTLGTSANWILTRYLCSSLVADAGKPRRSAPTPHGDLNEAIPRAGASNVAHDVELEDCAVILVSWMRDWDFWKVEGRRAAVREEKFESFFGGRKGFV